MTSPLSTENPTPGGLIYEYLSTLCPPNHDVIEEPRSKLWGMRSLLRFNTPGASRRAYLGMGSISHFFFVNLFSYQRPHSSSFFLAGRLEMSAPGVGFAVEKGKAIAHENGLKLIE
jgi:hypothetical protein